jgi:hypothetical protein
MRTETEFLFAESRRTREERERARKNSDGRKCSNTLRAQEAEDLQHIERRK